mgnify:CR=1 FL=1
MSQIHPTALVDAGALDEYGGLARTVADAAERRRIEMRVALLVFQSDIVGLRRRIGGRGMAADATEVAKHPLAARHRRLSGAIVDGVSGL